MEYLTAQASPSLVAWYYVSPFWNRCVTDENEHHKLFV